MNKKIKTAIAVASVAGAAAFGAATLSSADYAPVAVYVDGRPYTFSFTDDNANEDMIIRTNTDTYDGISESVVYFTVSNESGEDQQSDIAFLFKDRFQTVTKVEKLWVTRTDVPITEEVCITVVASSTEPYQECHFEQTGTVTKYFSYPKTIKTDVQELPLTQYVSPASVNRKNSQNYVTENSVKDFIPAESFGLYRATVKFSGGWGVKKPREKFYIEVNGSNNGYGHLDPWFDSLWGWRKSITLTGVTGAGTNNVVLLKIGESSGASGEDFDLNSKSLDFPNANDDGGDLRFTASDETTDLPFYVERVTGTTPNRLAWVWVKVSADLGTNQNIYVYYGNAAASNASNGVNTFEFFDDFNDGSISTTVWTTECFTSCEIPGSSTSGSIAESGGLLRFTDAAVAGSYARITADTDYLTDTAPGWLVHWKGSRNNTGTFANTQQGHEGDNIAYTNFGNDTELNGCNYTQIFLVENVDITNGLDYISELRREGASELEGGSYTDSDGALRAEANDQARSSACTTAYAPQVRSADGNDARMDYVFVAKFADGAIFNTAGAAECEVCTETFSTPGFAPWTAPTNVTSVQVACWGGGGAGFDGSNSGGGRGGGGGAFASSTVTVVPGTLYTIFIGNGGQTSGAAGTDSTFSTTTVVADGGLGGGDATTLGGEGGTVANSTGSVRFAGGRGGAGNGTDDAGGGGGGAAGPHGAGEVGQDASTTVGGNGGRGDNTLGGTSGAGDTNGNTAPNGGVGGTSIWGGGGGGGGDQASVGGAGGAYGGGGGGGENGMGTGAAGACYLKYSADAPAASTIAPQSEFWFD